MKTTTNDLKRLLLVYLYGDLRLPGYQQVLEEYVSNSDILVAVELIDLQTRFLMITRESLQVPASLISAFRAAFKKRHQLYGDQTSKGAYAKAYSADLEEAKRQHLNFIVVNCANDSLYRSAVAIVVIEIQGEGRVVRKNTQVFVGQINPCVYNRHIHVQRVWQTVNARDRELRN
jgi:hypothetical protein